jgi:hypothetical protein
MAIKIVSGVLGAGKTYYCVSELLHKYYKYDDLLDEWIQKDKESLVIVTNIDYIKLPCVPLDAVIQASGGLSGYFSVQLHNKDDVLRKVIIIDEAQKYFDRKFYDKSVFEFFQYSRHLGIDIYLITQDVTSLAKELQNIAEYEVQTVRRSFQMGLEFRYQLVAGGERIKTKILRKDQRVFAVYRSHKIKETEKITSVPFRFMIYFILAVLFVVSLYYFVLKSGVFFHGLREKPSPVASSKNPFPASQSVSVSIPISDPKTVLSSIRNPVPPPLSSSSLQLPECNAFGSACTRYVGWIEYELKGSPGLKEKVHVYQQAAPRSELSGEHSAAGTLLPEPLKEPNITSFGGEPERWTKTTTQTQAPVLSSPLFGGQTK